jgi:hypothetical protein
VVRRSKNRRSQRKKLEDKLDEAWRSLGKEGAVCEICASGHTPKNYTQLQAHHIIGRTSRNTRWDLRNRLWVCPSHHTLGQKDCVETNLGGWFLNWWTDEDWLGQHRLEDKRYLQEIQHVTKKWTEYELEELLLRYTSS